MTADSATHASSSDDQTVAAETKPGEKNDRGESKHLEKSATGTTAKNGENEIDALSYHEPFEWGELLRGFAEPQVWMTGIAYMAICVDLYVLPLCHGSRCSLKNGSVRYSYSLFLCVAL